MLKRLAADDNVAQKRLAGAAVAHQQHLNDILSTVLSLYPISSLVLVAKHILSLLLRISNQFSTISDFVWRKLDALQNDILIAVLHYHRDDQKEVTALRATSVELII